MLIQTLMVGQGEPISILTNLKTLGYPILLKFQR